MLIKIKFFFTQNNKEFIYRIESIKEKKSYQPSLKRGQRCIVLVDGFYEWQTTKPGNKQPYFVYSPQDNPEIKVWDRLV